LWCLLTPLSHIPSSSSATKTHDQQSPGPAESLAETAETVENKEGDPDMPEAAAEGDIQTEYSFDYFCKYQEITCKNFRSVQVLFHNWNI
jgi:hypothetical protein